MLAAIDLGRIFEILLIIMREYKFNTVTSMDLKITLNLVSMIWKISIIVTFSPLYAVSCESLIDKNLEPVLCYCIKVKLDSVVVKKTTKLLCLNSLSTDFSDDSHASTDNYNNPDNIQSPCICDRVSVIKSNLPRFTSWKSMSYTSQFPTDHIVDTD